MQIICAAGFIAAPLLSNAAITASVDRAAFQAAVASGTINTQTFDGLTNGTILGTLNGVTYSASTGSPLVTNSYLTTTSPNGLGRTGVGFFQNTDTATFAFANAITAFAIDVNTFATTNDSYRATLNTGDEVSSLFATFPGFVTGQFIGFVSNTPFSSVTIRGLSVYAYTLDTLVYGNASSVRPVPTPGTLAMLGLGLCALGWTRRRAGAF